MKEIFSKNQSITSSWPKDYQEASPSMLAGLDVNNQTIFTPWLTSYPLRPAAVILLFLLDPAQPSRRVRVVLTRRTQQVSSHKGQISFPGGRRDTEHDVTPVDTALRELNEELSVAASQVHVLGGLDAFYAIDNSLVYPVVGYAIMREQDLIPNENEVANVLLIDWPLLKREHCTFFSFDHLGTTRESPLFVVDGNRVWGLTAKILHHADFR